MLNCVDHVCFTFRMCLDWISFVTWKMLLESVIYISLEMMIEQNFTIIVC